MRRRLAERWRRTVAVALAVVGLMTLAATVALWASHQDAWGYDLAAYYNAALRWLATGSPYQLETLAGPFRPGPFGLYVYSPPLAVLIAPLTTLSFDGANLVWLLLHIALVIATCALLPVARWIRLTMLGIAAVSAPVLYDLNLGNVSMLVTFLAVMSWRWLDRPLGGVALGLSLTVRPTMAVLGIWWLLRRRWRPVAWTLATYGTMLVATLPFVGLEAWSQYVIVLRNLSDVTGVPRNVDLASQLLALSIPEPLAITALLAGYAIAVAAILLSVRRDRETGLVVTVTASLLLSPLLWPHYLTLLILPGALLAARGRPWGVLLPLAGWLPSVMLPFVAVLATLAPFLAAPAAWRQPDPCSQ